MYKFIKTFIIMIPLTLLLSLNIEANSVIDINELIENAKKYDGQMVTLQGEVIGERMDRKDYAWININDGTNAIGIWLKKSEVDVITHFGSYKYKGDTVSVTGIFKRACNEHGGEADLHNNTMQLVEEGHLVKEQISTVKIVATTILSILAIAGMFFLKTMQSKKMIDN